MVTTELGSTVIGGASGRGRFQAGKTAANEGGRLMRDFKILSFGQIWSLRVGTKMDHKKHFFQYVFTLFFILM